MSGRRRRRLPLLPTREPNRNTGDRADRSDVDLSRAAVFAPALRHRIDGHKSGVYRSCPEKAVHCAIAVTLHRSNLWVASRALAIDQNRLGYTLPLVVSSQSRHPKQMARE